VNTSDDKQHKKLQQESQGITIDDQQQRLQQESEVSSESHALTELLVVDSESEYQHQQPVIPETGVLAQPVKTPSEQPGTLGSQFQQQVSDTYTRVHRKEEVDSVKLSTNKLSNYRKQYTGYGGCSSESDSEMDELRSRRSRCHLDQRVVRSRGAGEYRQT